MIRGHCRTNLDDCDVSFVTVFASVPQKGDKVYAKRRGIEVFLEVCQIAHTVKTDGIAGNIPYIIVELTGRPR